MYQNSNTSTEPRKSSNIERVMDSTAHETLTEWRRAGAAAANKSRGIKRNIDNKLQEMLEQDSVPELMKGMLLGDLPPEERAVVRSFVPACIPDESISPMIALFYSVVNKAIQTGDASAMERILRMSGQSAELQVKLAVEPELDLEKAFDVKSMSDAELRALIAKYEAQHPEEDGSVIDADSYSEVL